MENPAVNFNYPLTNLPTYQFNQLPNSIVVDCKPFHWVSCSRNLCHTCFYGTLAKLHYRAQPVSRSNLIRWRRRFAAQALSELQEMSLLSRHARHIFLEEHRRWLFCLIDWKLRSKEFRGISPRRSFQNGYYKRGMICPDGRNAMTLMSRPRTAPGQSACRRTTKTRCEKTDLYWGSPL